MNARISLTALVFATVLSAACGSTSTSTASSSPSPTASPSPAPSPSSAAKLYTFAPEPNSTVSGTVRVESAASGATLTASIHGLKAGGNYIVDADPLPCMLFTGGPSQSFPKAFVADSAGSATVTWTVPSGMDGNASVQALLDQGTYSVLACADLTP